MRFIELKQLPWIIKLLSRLVLVNGSYRIWLDQYVVSGISLESFGISLESLESQWNLGKILESLESRPPKLKWFTPRPEGLEGAQKVPNMAGNVQNWLFGLNPIQGESWVCFVQMPVTLGPEWFRMEWEERRKCINKICLSSIKSFGINGFEHDLGSPAWWRCPWWDSLFHCSEKQSKNNAITEQNRVKTRGSENTGHFQIWDFLKWGFHIYVDLIRACRVSYLKKFLGILY